MGISPGGFVYIFHFSQKQTQLRDVDTSCWKSGGAYSDSKEYFLFIFIFLGMIFNKSDFRPCKIQGSEDTLEATLLCGL